MAYGNERPVGRNQDCIFCFIASGRDNDTHLLRKNRELVCFKDICPAAPHHYLVVPKRHIVSCSSLNRGHIDLVKQMAQMGKKVLQDQGITDMKNIRLGFHQPPYISVNHLHLHVLAPSSQISTDLRFKYTPETDWFVTEKHLQARLNKKEPRASDATITSLGWIYWTHFVRLVSLVSLK